MSEQPVDTREARQFERVALILAFLLARRSVAEATGPGTESLTP